MRLFNPLEYPITREQRYQIYILKEARHRQNFIARAIGTHPLTISRELLKVHGHCRYRPKRAEEFAGARKQKRYRPQCYGLSFDRATSASRLES